MELNNLPHELLLYIIKWFYTCKEYNHVSHAYALGVIREINHKYKDLVDELPRTSFYLTGKLALRFFQNPTIRHGAISRFCKDEHRELPLHLDFYGVTISVTKAELLQSPVVHVTSVSLVGAFQSINNLDVFTELWPATHTIREIKQLSVEQSMALVSTTPANITSNFPYWPISVNFRECCLRDANFYTLQNAHTVLMAYTTNSTPYQVSQLKNVRFLSLGSGFTNLECVRSLVHLRYLFFRNNPKITSIEPLHALEHLCYVDGLNTNVLHGAWTAFKQIPRKQKLWIVHNNVCEQC